MATESIVVFECDFLISHDVMLECDQIASELQIHRCNYKWEDRGILYAFDDPWLTEDIRKKGGEGKYLYEMNWSIKYSWSYEEKELQRVLIDHLSKKISSIAVWSGFDHDEALVRL